MSYPPVTTGEGTQVYFVEFGYTGYHNITSYRDRNGQVWLYGYGDPEVNGDPDALEWEQWPGITQRIQYALVQEGDLKGLRVTDARGVTTTFYHNQTDVWGRVVLVKDGQNYTTTLTYGDSDYAFAPSTVITPTGTQWQLDYDANGNMVGVTDPSGNRFDLSYDENNRLTQVLEPLVTDAWGNTEPARHRTEYGYDARGNLIWVKQYTDASNYLLTQYGYDAYGQLTTPAARPRSIRMTPTAMW